MFILLFIIIIAGIGIAFAILLKEKKYSKQKEDCEQEQWLVAYKSRTREKEDMSSITHP